MDGLSRRKTAIASGLIEKVTPAELGKHDFTTEEKTP